MTNGGFKAQLTELQAQSAALAMRIYELEAIMNWSANSNNTNAATTPMPFPSRQNKVVSLYQTKSTPIRLTP